MQTFNPSAFGGHKFKISMASKTSGTVKWFNDQKGFGFIKPDNQDKDMFVHKNGLIDDIRENDKVTFDVEEGRKGPNAVNVQLQ